ncbi:hypothetical protein RDWZM_010204 [Blomia tropicalis]|uniref:Uncharacterized protein n=1 Tax=Blomia tropicalis TaxID=40697 RepID=A0A9Q0LYM9_BLOTA|nr:hypothetical protein RDWZM_010204 [Blomia tropicalis]
MGQYFNGFLVSGREYICSKINENLIVQDAWSIKDQLLFLRIDQRDNQTKHNVQQLLLVYDYQMERFVQIFHSNDRQLIGQAEQSNKLSDLISVSIMKSSYNNHDNRSPSFVYFDTRNTLRTNCHSNWFYDPPNSAFCRRHATTTILGRVLSIIKPIALDKPEMVNNLNNYRVAVYRHEHFPLANVHQIGRLNHVPIQDAISQLIIASTLSLQVNNGNFDSRSSQNVRFMFSNKLGLFIAWLQSSNDHQVFNWWNNFETNCAVLLPVKQSPIIRICSNRFRFLSFIEFDPHIFILVPNNKIIKLNHTLITKQFRIHNNLEINLDTMKLDIDDSIETFLKCSTQSIRNYTY